MSNFTIKFTHSTVTSSTCNNLCLHLSVNPVTPLTSSYNYSAIVSLNDSRLANPSTIYSEGLLVYCYDYTETVQDVSIEITLNCTLLDSDTSKFPIMVMDTLILPNNNILALYYPPETCQTKDTMNSVTIAVTGATYGVLLISALPCKIIGLELIGVLQLAYLSLANMDNLNTMLQPLMYLKTTNGLNMPIVTSSSSVIPERVASISYEANFINNCNIMFAVVAVVIVAALFLYLLTFALKSYAPMLSEIAQRILKEVLLTLLLFNAFNFSYAAGIHFNYASHEDPLYIPSSCLAAAAVALPIIMALMLMVAE